MFGHIEKLGGVKPEATALIQAGRALVQRKLRIGQEEKYFRLRNVAGVGGDGL